MLITVIVRSLVLWVFVVIRCDVNAYDMQHTTDWTELNWMFCCTMELMR